MEGGFGPIVVFEIFGIQITQTVTTTWFIMAVLILFAFVATRKLEKVPRGIQNIAETLVGCLCFWHWHISRDYLV